MKTILFVKILLQLVEVLLEAAKQVENAGGNIVAYAALANRGFCSRVGSTERKDNCKLPLDKPFCFRWFHIPNVHLKSGL